MPDPLIAVAKRRPHRNRGRQPPPPFDIDTMSATDLLTSHEVAGLLRTTPGVVVEKWSGADRDDPCRPLHPTKVGGRWLFTVGNLRKAMKDSFLAARLRQVPAVPKPAPEKPVRRGGPPAARAKDQPAKPPPPKEVEDDAPARPALRRMISEEELLTIIPVARATLFRMIAKGTFPSDQWRSGRRPPARG